MARILRAYHPVKLNRVLALLVKPCLGDALWMGADIDAPFNGHCWVMRYEADGWAVYHSFIGCFTLRRQVVDGAAFAAALGESHQVAAPLWALLGCTSYIPPVAKTIHSIIFTTNRRPPLRAQIAALVHWTHGSQWIPFISDTAIMAALAAILLAALCGWGSLDCPVGLCLGYALARCCGSPNPLNV